MRERNEKIILENGVKSDFALISGHDTRQGIALFAFSTEHFNAELEKIRRELAFEFPNQVIYHSDLSNLSDLTYKGLFHSTFIQFLGVTELTPEEFSQDPKIYIDVLKQVLFDMGPYKIKLDGLIAIPSGLLVVGHPDLNINHYREKIRKLVQDENLPFKEPYRADISHATLMRLSNDINSEHLLSFAQKYKDTDFGEILVTKLYLGKGSWAMRNAEITMNFEFDLIEKKVKKL